MSKEISRVQNDVQDRESYAWKKLCEYIEDLAELGADEFSPRDYLGDKLSQVLSADYLDHSQPCRQAPQLPPPRKARVDRRNFRGANHPI